MHTREDVYRLDGTVLRPASPTAMSDTRIGRFLTWVRETGRAEVRDYAGLWEWSVDDLDGFWSAVWDYFEVKAHTEPTCALAREDMLEPQWFPGARLNYAERALTGFSDADLALIAYSQTTTTERRMSRGELADLVARIRAGLVRLGVRSGDRVVAYLPAIPEAVAALLATASLGAIWCVCPPEFGDRSVIARLGQLSPKVLLTIDGYRYGDKVIDRGDTVRQIVAGIDSLEHVVWLPYLRAAGPPAGAMCWDELIAESGPLVFEPVPFDHPLWVLFSSGTTGLPKAIVQGHGGILLEHLKALGLQNGLGRDGRYFFFTTTGWMMWNHQVSALLHGAAFVMLDGNPNHPDDRRIWQVVHDARVTNFGVSAAYLTQCRKRGLSPRDEFDLTCLNVVQSAGSPLPPEGWRWLHEQLPPNVFITSGSGGTDICSGIVGGIQLLPVREGEISGPLLGVSAYAYDEAGRPVTNQLGELVITKPMPSMPLFLWGDVDRALQRQSYFDMYPGVWRHGDWVVFNARRGAAIVGRSDATLNRGGVRLGTSEFYSAIETISEIRDSMVIHLPDVSGGMGTLYLFVSLADGSELTDALRARIAHELRSSLSPRHVPDVIRVARAIPKTVTGKKLEVPIKAIMLGAPIESTLSLGAITDAHALEDFVT
jgi:acetoacetyl-CoA synthetase